MTSQEKAEKFAASGPKLNKKEEKELNALFPAYIFRRHKTGEVWTSCCHRHEFLLKEKPAHRQIMEAAHVSEPKPYWQTRAPQEESTCPFCGAKAMVKELGRTGERQNLEAFRRAMVLRWHRGALWGMCYNLRKRYSGEYGLTAKPNCTLVAAYRFKPGCVEYTVRHCYFDNWPFSYIGKQTQPLTGGKWKVDRPFACTFDYGTAYSVIGMDEIQKSPFKYCQIAQAERRMSDFERLLTACCFYPRQIEMMMKAGMDRVVYDLLQGVKHAYVINWNETSPAKAFKVSPAELKEFLKTDRDIKTLEVYKTFHGIVKMEEAAAMARAQISPSQIKAAAKQWNIETERLLKYLSKQNTRTPGDMRSAFSAWKDYTDTALKLEYPLHRENVLLPADLGAAHDKAAEKYQQKIKREEAAERKAREKRYKEALLRQQKAYQERREALEKKYAYEMEGLLIRIPKDGAEIVEEGIQLKHCVAGYAERHVAGATTILFMRKKSAPGKPWLTIEINGNKLVQIHGYKNEGMYTAQGRFAPDPREEHREFLDTWLDWLIKGSPRNEDGTPKVKTKNKNHARRHVA